MGQGWEGGWAAALSRVFAPATGWRALWERGARNSRITVERQGRGLASHTLWKQPETGWDRVGCS